MIDYIHHHKHVIKIPFTDRTAEVEYTHRNPNSTMGRFGGGWDWQVGVQFSGRTVIFNLLVAMLRVDISKSQAS